MPNAMKIKELGKSKLQDNLRQVLPELEVKDIQANVKIGDARADFLFTGRIKGKEYIFICEAKSLGSPSHILPAIAQLKRMEKYKKGYPIILGPYISQRSAEICRQNEVGFMDLQGNVYLSFSDVLIDRRVKERNHVEKREIVEIFSPKATRIIRVLLENVNRERWLISELSQESEVSLGYASEVLNALVNQGYMEKQKRKGFQLKDGAGLLDRWASVYSFSQNKIVNLYTLEKDFAILFKRINDVSGLLKLKCGLTLLSAASIVAPYIARFSDIYLYVQGDIEMWREKLDLREVEVGANFHLITPYDEGVFYGLRKVKRSPIIGNIQLYLDLIKYPARGKEQAEYLRKQLIRF